MGNSTVDFGLQRAELKIEKAIFIIIIIKEYAPLRIFIFEVHIYFITMFIFLLEDKNVLKVFVF